MGKKSKAYYMKCTSNSRKGQKNLQAGMKGILITCSGNEARCVREAYNLLNEYADQVYGPERAADNPEPSDENSDEDISESLAKEVSALNEQHRKKDKRFVSARTGAKNVIFIQTSGVDPHRVVHSLFTDLEKTKTHKSRNIQRMLPVSCSCKAFEDKIEQSAQEMIYPIFHSPEAKDSTFCIMFKARNNKTVKKEQIVRLLAPMVMEGSTHIHKVDFDEPDYTVMVDVIGGVCCMSVLQGYVRFKKYNLHLVANGDGGAGAGAGAGVKGESGDLGEGSKEDKVSSGADVGKDAEEDREAGDSCHEGDQSGNEGAEEVNDGQKRKRTEKREGENKEKEGDVEGAKRPRTEHSCIHDPSSVSSKEDASVIVTVQPKTGTSVEQTSDTISCKNVAEHNLPSTDCNDSMQVFAS